MPGPFEIVVLPGLPPEPPPEPSGVAPPVSVEPGDWAVVLAVGVDCDRIKFYG